MDFLERKKNRTMPRADARNPWMGLNGVICENPAFWCRLHEVWLSEDDVARKKCNARTTYDMLSTRRCNCLEVRKENPFLSLKK